MYKGYNDLGFSLTELMVAIGIITVLIVIAVPMYLRTVDIAQIRACNANIRIINGAALQYWHGNGELPNSIEEIVSSGFIQSTPRCPSGGNYSYDNDTGTAQCDIPTHQ